MRPMREPQRGINNLVRRVKSEDAINFNDVAEGSNLVGLPVT